MEKTDFLGEDNFTEVMETENRRWREKYVKQGTLRSYDNTALNYYYALHEKPKAVVAFLHGFCEFWGKYHEYAWYLHGAGFSVYFLEQRGHGYSEGKNREIDVAHIDDYGTYVEDFRIFMDKVVRPSSGNLKKILIAHSMGGAVGTLFLEENPGFFDAAILSSPMLRLKNKTSPVLIEALRIYSGIFGKRKKIAPGQHHFDPTPVFEGCSALSRPRFDYMFEMRKKDWHYQTYGASIGWALASLKATERLMKNAGKIKIPVTVFTAGNDHLIDPEGYRAFAGLVPQAQFIPFEKSRHEIFNADEEDRKKYFACVLETLEEYAKKSRSCRQSCIII